MAPHEVSLDWPGLLREIKAGGWKFFAVLFLVSLAIAIAPTSFPTTFPEPDPRVVSTARLLALGSLVVLGCYFLGWAAGGLRRLFVRPGTSTSPAKLRQKYSTLTGTQKDLMVGVYQTGKRTFEWRHDSFRWFEELQELGFIRVVPMMFYVGGQPLTYELTISAWQVLEEMDRKNELR